LNKRQLNGKTEVEHKVKHTEKKKNKIFQRKKVWRVIVEIENREGGSEQEREREK